ncbi:SulP family inorganic anion transporter [Thiohalocapsa marina]|uniref:SulP family inorganic anion transporter n=1 Tax=Thiohalocapsa marina TaxID=424902 RepID=A0A5M8FNG3_9GAMM|nr:SulP family inorganic anion transporter [Thiohalocapsa marina]KAA6185540.1 SulP family inorganic anion transporter [Thiohalocapsa marina]
MNALHALLPFLRWFPMRRDQVRADLIAGITVALVLVPQSMAYAQLAGLPVVYGLYASFLPVIVASLWGSCSQLHTGPVAMLSIMSAAAVIPFAAPGSAGFIELSVMLALMVGMLRLALGLFKLGAIVNLLSSPVIVGFTNAAALIIGLSQLSKIIGVPFPRSDNYLADLWRVVEQVGATHWPTLLFAAGAYVLIVGLKRFFPKAPGVLIAVLASTVLAGLVGYEHKTTVPLDAIQDIEAAATIQAFGEAQRQIDLRTETIAAKSREMHRLEAENDPQAFARASQLAGEIHLLEYQLENLKRLNNARRVDLHALTLEGAEHADGLRFFHPGALPPQVSGDGRTWHFAGLSDGQVTLSSGGAVVGEIPQGLPSFQVPSLQWDLMLALLPAAIVMALIGFMEATSISKAIATSTGERVDASKELVGQGLANIVGSFFSSYTVSGSFSRSAVAAKTGATTGLFAIISALAVVLVLLFFTPYLYNLPQSVLAVIVMMAVFSLIRIAPLRHAWRFDRSGALIGIATFFATLAMAPAIANGILFGIVLTVLAFLFKSMRPRAEIVARKPDGSLSGIRAHRLEPISQTVVPVRFDGSLVFSTVAYFEDIVIEAVGDFPQAKVILMIGSGINEIDASGEEKVREVIKQLEDNGVTLYFSGLKHQVMSVFERTGLVDEIGRDRFYPTKEAALQDLLGRFDSNAARTA